MTVATKKELHKKAVDGPLKAVYPSDAPRDWYSYTGSCSRRVSLRVPQFESLCHTPLPRHKGGSGDAVVMQIARGEGVPPKMRLGMMR